MRLKTKRIIIRPSLCLSADKAGFEGWAVKALFYALSGIIFFLSLPPFLHAAENDLAEVAAPEIKKLPEEPGVEKPELFAQEDIPLKDAELIKGIELGKSSDDEVVVSISLDGKTSPKIFQVGDDRVVIDIPNVLSGISAPAIYEPPVAGVRIGKHPDKRRIVFDLTEPSEFYALVKREKIIVSFKKPRAASAIIEAPEVVEEPPEVIETKAEPIVSTEITRVGDILNKIKGWSEVYPFFYFGTLAFFAGALVLTLWHIRKRKNHDAERAAGPAPETAAILMADRSKNRHTETQSVLYQEAKVNGKGEVMEVSGISQVSISPAIGERGNVLTKEESAKIYEEAISLVKEIEEKALTDDVLECKSITSCVDKLVEQLILDNESLLELTARLMQYNLYSHAVNVCILSIKTGAGLGYDKAELIELGSSALLHDIGMIKYIELAGQPRKLTTTEYNEIKKHPITGSEILEKAKELPETAVYVALQEHERMDGSGYPRGLKGEYIHEYARIVGLVDSYEAITHSRPYRDKYMPSEAIQELLRAKSAFEYKLIKILIEGVGIFPMGSLVRLNTKETGEVAGINRGFPTRPVLNIMYDCNNQRLEKIKVVDLTKETAVYIEKVVKK